MTVKTTFRGGGGGERPENYTHKYPQVRQSGEGLPLAQFGVQHLDPHQMAIFAEEKQRAEFEHYHYSKPTSAY
jgi:hypothetical protein